MIIKPIPKHFSYLKLDDIFHSERLFFIVLSAKIASNKTDEITK